MNITFSAAIAAVAIGLAGTASADTVLNTELGPVAAPGTTTTTASGTRSTNSTGSNVSETFAANEWQQRNIRGDGVVGITTDYAQSGNGSIFFSTTGGGSKADMEYYFSESLAFSDFEGASYDWYRDGVSGNAGNQVPSLRLFTSANTYLIYEPVYQSGSTFPVNTWVTESIGSGDFLWANNTGGLSVPANQACTPGGQCASTAAWQTANPNLRILGFSTGVGSGWNGGAFRGAVDNISFTFNETTVSYNFEVAGAGGVVPEPSTWAMMLLGFGGLGVAIRRRRASLLAA